MSIADSRKTGPRWARSRAIDLWVCFDDRRIQLESAEEDGAIVAEYAAPTAFAIFEAMRAAAVGDVRRVGVVGGSVEALRAGRAAGAAAVVGTADDAAGRRALLAAEPDAVVPPDGLSVLDRDRYGTKRTIRPQVLLNPGPGLTTDSVKRAAAGVDLCHREPEFRELERGIREKLLATAEVGDDWSVVLIAASGTAADELALASSVRPGRRLVLVENGIYGERLRTMAERRGIGVDVVASQWTERPSLDAVAEALARPGIDALAVVHHETTSGLLNPVHELAALARDAGVRVVVDAVSSFGAEDLDLAGAGIDFLACSSNKCLHGLPGAAFVLVSPEGRERANEVPPTSVYLDLTGYLEAADVGTVPFTPSIPALASLNAALDELELEGGTRARGARYAERAAVLDTTFERLGLDQIVAREHRSRSVRSVRLPAGVTFAELHDSLKDDGYVIYAGQGPLAREIFRVCCLGALEPAALEGFAESLECVLLAQSVR